MSFDDDVAYKLKVVMLGDSDSGKTSVLMRYSNNDFSSKCKTTIGVDTKLRAVQLDEENVILDIWDTAGSKRFREITGLFYRGAMGIILVYDVTNVESFKEWISDIDKVLFLRCEPGVNVMLIGNKCDKTRARKITQSSGAALAAKHGYRFMETSAKSGEGVEEAFMVLSKDIKTRVEQKIKEGKRTRSKSLTLTKRGRNDNDSSSCSSCTLP